VQAKKAEIGERVRMEEARIATLRAEKGFWRTIRNWFSIRGRTGKIARARAEESRYIAELSDNIAILKSVLNSPELAGAEAEIDVVARLERLSAEHTIFNDVRLRASRFIKFDGIPLQSAQIDHLVLAPSGVFVIETKRWSRQFATSGRYHNPFDQTRRASYLCYRVLEELFGKIAVRSVIASDGSLPAPPPESHVKVLRPSQLSGYISWFKQREIMPDQLQAVTQFLKHHVNN